MINLVLIDDEPTLGTRGLAVLLIVFNPPLALRADITFVLATGPLGFGSGFSFGFGSSFLVRDGASLALGLCGINHGWWSGWIGLVVVPFVRSLG